MNRPRTTLIALITAIFVLIVATATGLIGIGTIITTQAAATGLDPLAVAQANVVGCQTWLAAHTANTSQHTRIVNYCTDQQAIVAALQATPTPSVSPSGGPTVSPTSTPTPSPTVTPSTPAASPSPTPPPTSPPTPSPTPTTTPAQNNCVANPGGCGFPDATTTGVPAGTSLLTVNGDMNISGAGTVLDGLDVHGCVTVTAANVTIRNSRITCAGGFYGIDFSSSSTTASGTVSHVEVSCAGTTATGIGELRFTADHINVHHCENGFDVDFAATITDTWCHDLGGSDNDCVQGIMTSDVTIRHNSLIGDSGDNSAIEGDGGTGGHKNGWVVDNNILSGGGYTLYCPRVASQSTGVSVTNNRFGPYVFGYADLCGPYLWSGNVRDSDGMTLTAV